MLWILSTSEPCGFFPLGDSVVSVLFRDAVDSLDIVIVVMNITVSRSPPPVQLEGMHRRPRTALTMIVITIVVIVVVVADVVIVVALVVSFEVPSSSSAESNHAP